MTVRWLPGRGPEERMAAGPTKPVAVNRPPKKATPSEATLRRRRVEAAIVAILRDRPERSDSSIGHEIGTHNATVRRVRERLEGAGEIPRLERFLGDDGAWRSRTWKRTAA